MKSSSPQSLMLFGAKKFLHSVKQIVIGRKTQQQCHAVFANIYFLPIYWYLVSPTIYWPSGLFLKRTLEENENS